MENLETQPGSASVVSQSCQEMKSRQNPLKPTKKTNQPTKKDQVVSSLYEIWWCLILRCILSTHGQSLGPCLLRHQTWLPGSQICDQRGETQPSLTGHRDSWRTALGAGVTLCWDSPSPRSRWSADTVRPGASLFLQSGEGRAPLAGGSAARAARGHPAALVPGTAGTPAHHHPRSSAPHGS